MGKVTVKAMSQMDPGENEYEQAQDEPEDEETEETEETRSLARDEQSARTFFAFLSFFVAIILLGTFLTVPLDGLSKMVVLFASVAFGILGALLLERRFSPHNTPRLYNNLNALDEPVDAEEPDDEDDEETRRQRAFEQLVQEALDSIPPEFHGQMENLVVIVEDQPDAATLKHAGSEEGGLLLGLYQGVPLTAQGYQRSPLPERITIYQRAIERYCQGNPDRIRDQVRATVLHEVAHHFGMGHEEMPIWVK